MRGQSVTAQHNTDTGDALQIKKDTIFVMGFEGRFLLNNEPRLVISHFVK